MKTILDEFVPRSLRYVLSVRFDDCVVYDVKLSLMASIQHIQVIKHTRNKIMEYVVWAADTASIGFFGLSFKGIVFMINDFHQNTVHGV